jgi:hypothetical protein
VLVDGGGSARLERARRGREAERLLNWRNRHVATGSSAPAVRVEAAAAR